MPKGIDGLATLIQNSLSCGRSVLESFTRGYKRTIVCDGSSAYGNLKDMTFANYRAMYGGIGSSWGKLLRSIVSVRT